jgi:hypothetical protein
MDFLGSHLLKLFMESLISQCTRPGGFGYPWDQATDSKGETAHRRSPTMRQERTVQASIFHLFADQASA